MRARAVKGPRKGPQILWSALGLVGLALHPAFADDPVIRNNFGGVGMIDMPSARVAPDGELSAGASFFKNTQHYNFDFEILPWLEGSFRYSGLQHLNPEFPVYYDRSFALKARLWDETRLVPAIAIGINDIVGSGIYGGEYLVASKKFGPIDTTLGIGWGRLGSTGQFKNPLAAISNSFDTRPVITLAGGADFSSLFHGPTSSVFGGAVWHTPFEGLSLVAEYSSDNYVLEAKQGNFRPRDQFNVGAAYRVDDSIVVGLNWLYGTTIGASVAFELDPTRPQYNAKIEPPPPPAAVRAPEAQQQALNKMLQRKSDLAANAIRASYSKDAGWVDTLWRKGYDFTRVEVKGTSLYLFGNVSIKQNTCKKIARLAAPELFREIIIARRVGDRNAVRCNTSVSARQVERTRGDTPPILAGTLVPLIEVIDAATGAQIDTAAATRMVRKDASAQRIEIAAIHFSQSVATVYYINKHYYSEQDGLDRLTRLLMSDAPTNIEMFRLISVVNDQPQREFDVLRTPAERSMVQSDGIDIADNSVATYPPLQNPILAAASRTSFPKFTWGIFPFLRQELFDPDNPFAIQLGVAADASIELRRGLTLNSEVETSLYDDFNISRDSGSDLPRVRSDFLKYFGQGKTGIGELHSDYRFRIAPNIFALVKAGYLESMFAGGGGEVLWRPDGQRWAMGADIYEVWQRDFNRLFGLQSYRATTGHVSMYYVSPWYNLNFTVSAGQYLAGDRGLTLQITRRFSTGVEIGAFATKTNVSSAQFGEGSFDKGIVIRIPLGWTLPVDTQSSLGIDLRPVQRDGGQRLQGDATLYEGTRRDSEAELALHTNRAASP